MNTEYDVIIIGAGVAGMSAALNCRRAEKSVLHKKGKINHFIIQYRFFIKNFVNWFDYRNGGFFHLYNFHNNPLFFAISSAKRHYDSCSNT